MSERNLLMPGVCGPAENIFTPPTEAARAACFSCIQFEQCSSQRERVAQELQIRGFAGETVIAGEVVNLQAPTETLQPIDGLRPSQLQWNLQKLPYDPAQALTVLRQGMITGQIPNRYSVKSPFFEKMAGIRAELYGNPDAALLKAIGAPVYRKTIDYITRTIFKQRTIAQAHERDLTPVEYDLTTKVARLMLEDVAELTRGGFAAALEVAKYHSAAECRQIVAYYEGHPYLTTRALREVFRHAVADPITAIERTITRNRAAKEQNLEVVLGRQTKKPPIADADIQHVFDLLADIPGSEATVRANLNDAFQSRSTKLGMERLEIWADAFRSVSRAYPEVAPSVRADICWRYSDPVQACRKYSRARTGLERFAARKEFTKSRLDWMALNYLDRATAEAEAYSERASQIYETARRYGFYVIPTAVHELAATGSLPESPEEIARVLLARQLQTVKLSRNSKNVRPWIVRKLVDICGRSARPALMALLSLFENGYAAISMTEGDKILPDTLSDSTSGNIVTLTDAFFALPSNRQEAVLGSEILKFLLLGKGEPPPYVDISRPPKSEVLRKDQQDAVYAKVQQKKANARASCEERPAPAQAEPGLSRALLPYQAIRQLAEPDRAAIYYAHQLTMQKARDTELREAGWTNEQQVWDHFGVNTRAELIELVQSKIMPKVWERLRPDPFLRPVTVTELLHKLDQIAD